MAKLLWQKGQPVYSEWLKTLTPEEYESHLEKRRKDKLNRTLEEDWILMLKAQREEWLTELNNTAAEILADAKENKDAQAWAILFDRLIGKTKAVDVTSNGNTIQAPTIIFTNKELPEWIEAHETK